jgi:hypothetical protein
MDGIAELTFGPAKAGPFSPPARPYNIVAARANATNNKAVEDEIRARNGSGSVIPGNAEAANSFPPHRRKLMISAETASFVDFAELLFQFDNQTVDALFRYRIIGRSPCKRPVFHDLHFEFHSLVFWRHGTNSRTSCN